MPRPKRAAAAAVKREPELLTSSDDGGAPSGSEYAPSPSPAPRRARAKRAPPAYDSCDDDGDEFTPPPPRRAPKKEAKKAKKEEPGSDEKKKVKREPKNPINVQLGMPAGWENPDGWPYVLAKVYGEPTPSPKVAAFDMDGTLIVTHNHAAEAGGNAWGAAHWGATRPEDFDLFNAGVPDKLRALVDDGYHIVILSNQGNIRGALAGKRAAVAMQRFDLALGQLGVPATALIATASKNDNDPHLCRKPGTGLWTLFTQRYAGGVAPDLGASFFCGDAAGRAATAFREGDFASSDADFAEAVGLPFFVPEDKLGDAMVKGEDGAYVKPEPGARGGRAAAAYVKDDTLPTKDGIVVFLRALGAKFKDIDGFKSRAYYNAAKAFDELAEYLPDDGAACIARIKALTKAKTLKGVGKGTLAKLEEWFDKGTCDALAEDAGDAGAAAPLESAALAFA